MTIMTAEGSITRAELSLATLNFGTSTGAPGTPGAYLTRNGWNLGEKTYRRITAESPYVGGRVLVHAVPDVQTATLRLRVKGSDQQDLYNRINELSAAFSQFSYTLTINVNHKTWIYLCEAADMTLGEGGSVDDLMARSNTQYMNFTIPHSPLDTGSYGSAGTYPVIE